MTLRPQVLSWWAPVSLLHEDEAFCAFEILPFSSLPFIQVEAVRKFALETTSN